MNPYQWPQQQVVTTGADAPLSKPSTVSPFGAGFLTGLLVGSVFGIGLLVLVTDNDDSSKRPKW